MLGGDSRDGVDVGGRETKVPGMTAGLACAAGWLGFLLPGNCRGGVRSPEMHPYPGREAKNAALGNKLGRWGGGVVPNHTLFVHKVLSPQVVPGCGDSAPNHPAGLQVTMPLDPERSFLT